MKAQSAQDAFYDELSAAHGSVFCTHHPSGPDQHCSGCISNAEGAFMRACRTWERFLFELLTELIAGCRTQHDHLYFVTSRFPQPSVQDARRELLRSRVRNGFFQLRSSPGRYLLLHSPATIIAVADYWLESSSVSAIVIAHQTDIDDVIRLRHGAAHGSDDAQAGMRSVLVRLDPLRLYPSLGSYLLSRPPGGGDTQFERILTQFFNWAIEMSP